MTNKRTIIAPISMLRTDLLGFAEDLEHSANIHLVDLLNALLRNYHESGHTLSEEDCASIAEEVVYEAYLNQEGRPAGGDIDRLNALVDETLVVIFNKFKRQLDLKPKNKQWFISHITEESLIMEEC